MKPLPPVPIPAAQRWRDFRLQVLPVLVFLGALLAAGYLWKEHVVPPTFVGEVEPLVASVTSPQTGLIAVLKVNRFQTVSAGDPVAIIQPADPRLELTAIQSEIDVLRIRLEPGLSE